MEHIVKYPRTRHVEGSRLQAGDEDLKCVKFESLNGRFLVLEEKVDGANCGISFDKNGKLHLQSRGHYLNGGYKERQFDLFKLWANCFSGQLFHMLGSRYIMYGEWLYAKHTVYYNALTHYFMEFDIYDREAEMFLSTRKRQELLKVCPFIVSVRILYEGTLSSLDELKSYLGKSQFKTELCYESLKHQCEIAGLSYELARKQTDDTDLMEGIYIKVESGEVVTDRLKYVRSSFLNTILDSQTHWADRPIIPNQLGSGIDIFSNGSEEG
ncbi:MAG: RNA ligase family protein [Lachnospiraceae bacterium]